MMQSIPCSEIEDISNSDFIIIPFIKGERKKIIHFVAECNKAHIAEWSQVAAQLLSDHSPEHGKSIIQYVGKSRLILLGIDESFSYQKISNAARSALFKLKESKDDGNAIVILPSCFKSTTTSAISNGLSMAMMKIDYYKSNKKEYRGSLSFYPEFVKSIGFGSISEGLTLAHTQQEICKLVNMPANEKNPQFLSNWAKEKFSSKRYTIKILNQSDLKEEGLHALLAVGRGSKTPPYLLVIKYNSRTKGKAKHIGLIGKGVTFDTGGISLKDPLNMHLMKSDMGGAAAVLGAMDMIGRLGLKVNVTAVIPFAENAIGSDAYRPGDVISSYSGKSIEVIDTDAEGRLILADAISYMIRNYKPDVMIDLATLTGSVIATLGYKAAGLFTNSEALAKSIRKSADTCGERVWRLPLWDEYQDEMNSDIADIKNLATKPIAGAITAAKFLQTFTEDHPAWAHLDIAGVAMMDSEYSKQRSATAYGVLLLKQWIEDFAHSK